MIRRDPIPNPQELKSTIIIDDAPGGRTELPSHTLIYEASFPVLKSWRGIHPQHPGLSMPGILPAVRRGTFEIETVALPEPIESMVERYLQFALENEEKFLPFVAVRIAAARLRGDAEQVGLHDLVPPSQ